ncbi:MAG: HEAT repeat domain-containing protein [Planctomycetes bacterium]|nr:HEAT repeat domain-containing protein [Planctomycetota bacterium]
MTGANRNHVRIRVVTFMAGVVAMGAGTSHALAQTLPRIERFRFDIKEKTAPRELLPTPPKAVAAPTVMIDDLAHVPEVHFQEPVIVKTAAPDANLSIQERAELEKQVASATRKAMLETAHQTAKINHLNQKKQDLFMETLIEDRKDLAGLPFLLGDACRLKKFEKKDFHNDVAVVRSLFNDTADAFEGVDRFWRNYDAHIKEGKGSDGKNRFTIAGFMQVLGPEPLYQKGLVERLKTFGKQAEKDVTEALARLAVFSMDPKVRGAALAALEKRDCGPADSVLLKGLRYPWPSVAQNAADAVAQLKRKDLIGEFIKMLDEPDPRSPVMLEVQGKKAPVVRELVRINHHRNCLLCHPPGNTEDVLKQPQGGKWSELEKGVQSHVTNGFPELAADVVFAAMPTPGEPIRISGYGSFSFPDVLVRIDATYLRQDFSLLLDVVDAHPWPKMQRFDFLVRTRQLTEGEAQAYRVLLQPKTPATLSPYHAAAVRALRALTGRDTEPTAQAWRNLLAQ